MTSKNQKITDEEIARIAGEAGAMAALKIMECEKRKWIKAARDNRLQNTRLLLENYKPLKEYSQNAIFELFQLDDEIIAEIMESVFTREDLCVNSIKESAERTYVIMNHIDKMLRVYEIFCETSGKPEHQRRYNSLISYYIADERLSIDEIAVRENVDRRTAFRDVEVAVEKLTALMFGVDGVLAK